ncbi:MAG: GNAT family N-acetyltransferase [Chloroflexota bacterium]|nr:GNAT family N-acetyltransferase [Chloroflexota bacterium]
MVIRSLSAMKRQLNSLERQAKQNVKTGMDEKLKLEVIHAGNISSNLHQEILALCNKAFGEDLKPLFTTFKDATHVLGSLDTRLVSHALWVTRWLQVGNEPVMRTANIEAVATEKEYRNRGFAATVMKRVVEEIKDFDLGALSPSRVAFYELLGWELWRGPLFIRTDDGLLRTPGDEDVMILRLPRTPILDLYAPLSAEWREGELW